jgi:hypothetical protein
MNDDTTKAKRVRLTVEKKVEIIRDVEKTPGHRKVIEVARAHGLPRTTVSGILAAKTKIFAECCQSPSSLSRL